MPRLRFNEGKACDAILRRLEAREGKTRRDVRFPEREGYSAPIELVCEIGDELYALEHTGIGNRSVKAPCSSAAGVACS